ncbi:MAG TPA: tetratricopeptide repeat protein, partial [Gammaproteobacteria bacterium]
AAEASKNGDPEGALRIIEEGLAADTASVDLNTYAGHFAIAAAAKTEADKQAQFFNTAVKYYGHVYAAKGNETDPNILQNYVLALLQVNRGPEAMDIAQKAVAAKGSDAGVWLAYANALKETGRLNEALAALDTVAARDPKTPRVASRRAQWLLDANKLSDATAAFRVAIQKGDIDAETAVNLVFRPGFEKYRANSFDAALDYFAAARDLAQDAKSRGMANFWSGMVYYQRGISLAKPQTPKAARAALPLFQRALSLLQADGVDEYAGSTRGVNLGQTISAVKQYIDIQNQIIKRG